MANKKSRKKTTDPVPAVLQGHEGENMDDIVFNPAGNPYFSESDQLCTEAESEEQPQEQVQNEQLSALQVLSQLTEIPVNLKEFNQGFILLTYDLPVTDEGNAARRDFLAKAGRLGAVAHSESVYFLPWTNLANSVALDLSRVQEGKVYIWYAKPEESLSNDLEEQYDTGLTKQVDKLEERTLRILEHASSNHAKTAQKMLEGTWETFQGLSQAAIARQSEELARRLNQIREALVLAQRFADSND